MVPDECCRTGSGSRPDGGRNAGAPVEADPMLVEKFDYRTGRGSDRLLESTVSLAARLKHMDECYISTYVERRIRSLPLPVR